jgi:hypothetical protein
MHIEEFASLGAYVNAQTAKGNLAGVPISLVAEHLNVSSAAVTAMLNDGRLDGVRIGRNTLVTLNSLQARQTMRAGQESTIYAFLRKRAHEGVRVVFYEPVMAQVGLTPRIPAHRTRIGGLLGAASEKSFKEDGVLLSVLVHQKKSGITRPGKGFFELAYHLGFKWDDMDLFIGEETDKVLAAYS